MINLSFHSIDSRNQRVYFKGSNKRHYCLQQEDSFGKMALMVCSNDGEPEGNVAYPQLFHCDHTLTEIEMLIASDTISSPDLLNRAFVNLQNLESSKIKVLVNRTDYTLVESYRDKLIGCSNGVFAVIDPVQASVFIPSIDDSKLSGVRKSEQSQNTIKASRAYIDYISATKTNILNIGSVDKKAIELTNPQIEDIVSHAVQLVESNQDEDVYQELKEALESSGIVQSKPTNSMSN